MKKKTFIYLLTFLTMAFVLGFIAGVVMEEIEAVPKIRIILGDSPDTEPVLFDCTDRLGKKVASGIKQAEVAGVDLLERLKHTSYCVALHEREWKCTKKHNTCVQLCRQDRNKAKCTRICDDIYLPCDEKADECFREYRLTCARILDEAKHGKPFAVPFVP